MTQLDRLARAILTMDGKYLHRWATDHQAKRKRTRAKSAPRLKAVRASKEQRRENLAVSREAVILRSRAACEACGRFGVGSEVHHLLGGVGNRRKYEGPNSLVNLCRDCHGSVHENDPDAIAAMLSLAVRMDAPFEVQAALNRRLAKARRGGAA